jgi:DnaJ-domain-containing protein 1
MGYDMHWVETPQRIKDGVAAADKVFHEACVARNAFPANETGRYDSSTETLIGGSPAWRAAQEAVSAAQANVRQARIHYFRLNNGGMHQYRQAMVQLHMVHFEGDHPAWPVIATYPYEDLDLAVGASKAAITRTYKRLLAAHKASGNPDEQFEYVQAAYDILRDPVRRAEHDALLAASEAVLSWRPDDVLGICGWKLCSNDGWLVTPDECSEVAALYEEQGYLVGDGTEPSYWSDWMFFIKEAAYHGGFLVY